MSLIDSMMESFVVMDKTRVSDGEGGFDVAWVPGVTIQAAIGFDSSMEATIGQAQGVTSLYRVITKKNVSLEYHDVIKRVKDGKIFRITSDSADEVTPDVSTLDMRRVTAESWSLTT